MVDEVCVSTTHPPAEHQSDNVGSYVSVSVGQMRNGWYPRSIAAYVTHTELKDLKSRNVQIERDFTYQADEVDKKGKRRRLAESSDKEVDGPAAAEARTKELEEQLRRRQQVGIERISVCPMSHIPSAPPRCML